MFDYDLKDICVCVGCMFVTRARPLGYDQGLRLREAILDEGQCQSFKSDLVLYLFFL